MRKIIILFFIICFASCKQIEYVTVPEVHTQYATQTIHDFVDRWRTHYEYVHGDTVFAVDTFYRDRFRIVRDTMLMVDSVPVVHVDTSQYAAFRSEIQGLNRERNMCILLTASLFIAFGTILAVLYGKKR